jgi:hypothetical protein
MNILKHIVNILKHIVNILKHIMNILQTRCEYFTNMYYHNLEILLIQAH